MEDYYTISHCHKPDHFRTSARVGVGLGSGVGVWVGGGVTVGVEVGVKVRLSVKIWAGVRFGGSWVHQLLKDNLIPLLIFLILPLAPPGGTRF